MHARTLYTRMYVFMFNCVCSETRCGLPIRDAFCTEYLWAARTAPMRGVNRVRVVHSSERRDMRYEQEYYMGVTQSCVCVHVSLGGRLQITAH